jgi:hypothetical protein
MGVITSRGLNARAQLRCDGYFERLSLLARGARVAGLGSSASEILCGQDEAKGDSLQMKQNMLRISAGAVAADGRDSHRQPEGRNLGPVRCGKRGEARENEGVETVPGLAKAPSSLVLVGKSLSWWCLSRRGFSLAAL